jgi:hypothetical protein
VSYQRVWALGAIIALTVVAVLVWALISQVTWVGAQEEPTPPTPTPFPIPPPTPSFNAGGAEAGPVPLMPNGRCPKEFPVKQGGACFAS